METEATEPLMEIRESYLGSLSEEALLSLGSMEGLGPPPVGRARPAVKKASVWPGYAAAAAVAAVAYLLHYLPFPPFRVVSEAGIRRPLSTAILAILAGVAAGNLFRFRGSLVEGCKSLVRKLIPATIVLTGAGLNLAHIAQVGPAALAVTLLSMGVALASTLYFGRLFGLWPRTSLLIGAGTAICGNSAIVAVAPLIDAEDEELLVSIGTVNLMGLLLMFSSPLIGALLQLGDQRFGVWAGASIHAVPQVMVAGFAYSREAGTLAMLVKLVRVTMLVPLVFVVAAVYARRRRASGGGMRIQYGRLVPLFFWGFLALAGLSTLGLLPALEFPPGPLASGRLRVPLSDLLAQLATVVLTLSMAAMGLEVNLRYLASVGGKALLTGAAASATLCVTSLLLIRLLL